MYSLILNVTYVYANISELKVDVAEVKCIPQQSQFILYTILCHLKLAFRIPNTLKVTKC